MTIYYNEQDITAAASVKSALATDCEGGCADSIELNLTDIETIWPRWRPVQGDFLRISHREYDSGVMYVDRIELEPVGCRLHAVSIPDQGRQPTWQAWENYTLHKLIGEIAARHGLSVSLYGVADRAYPRLQQDGQSDLQWLAYRCMLEGVNLKLHDGRLIAYDQAQRESGDAVRRFDLAGMVGYRYDDRAAERVSSYTVVSGSHRAVAKDVTGRVCRGGARAEHKLAAYSAGEALRYAKGLLRETNKYSTRLDIQADFDGVYAAGECVEVQGNRMVSGKWFVSRVNYNLIDESVSLRLRLPYEE